MPAVDQARGGHPRPFVGREQERALLRHLLREAGTGQPAVVVVSGVPGAGKTALLHWVGDTAATAGAFVLRTSGSEGTVAFDALRRLLAPLPELATLLDRDASEDVPVVGGDHAGRIGTEMAEALAAHARRRLLAVVLDDTHDLDRSSEAILAAALAALDDTGARTPLHLLVVLAAREPVPDGSLAARALRLDAGRSLPVGGFDAQDIRDMLASSGQGASPARVRELLEDTGGLPLLVESVIDRRNLPGGTGRLAGSPVRLRTIADALRERLAVLDAGGLAMLRTAALLGEPWEPASLAAAGGFDAATVVGVMEAAAGAHIVRPGPHGLRFAHPLVRAELLDGVTDESRRQLHRTIADRLAATAGGDGELDDATLVRVADHRLRSRLLPGAPGWPGEAVVEEDVTGLSRRAGAVAARWGAWHDAARFLAAAADGAGDADAGPLCFEAGSAAYLAHDPERAELLLGRAIDVAGRAGDPVTALRAAMFLARRRAGARFRLGTRVELGELEAALADVDGVDVALVVEAEAALAEALIVSGETDWALDVVARTRARAAGDTRRRALDGPLARVDFAEGIHRLRRLELSAADACFRTGERRAIAADDTLTAVYNRSRRALTTLMRGTVGDARAQALALEDDALACGYPGESGFAAAQLALSYALCGAAVPTAEAAERAQRVWRATDFGYIAALLAPVMAATGAATQGVGGDRDGRGMAPRAGDLPRSAAVRVLAAVEANDAAGARAQLRASRWRHGFRGAVTQASDGVAVALVEGGDLLGQPALVASAGEAVDAMLGHGVLVTSGWPTTVPRIAAVVARHAGDPARAERLVSEALRLCEREGLAAERPKALLELGRCASAAGSPSADVAALFAEAVRDFDRLSMHGWVARADEIAQPLGFSVLAAHGADRSRAIYTDDVVGSTESNWRLGDTVYLEQLRVHDRLVRARLREFGGQEIKHTGDGVNAVFADPVDAVRCALAVQRDIDAWQRSEPGLALQIRSGLAYGPVIPSGGDFFGLVQSEAARLCGLAAPGEVLATAAVVAGLPAGAALVKPLGPSELKGLPDPIEVFHLDEA